MIWLHALRSRHTAISDSFITVPGIETLTESQRIAVCKKTEQRLISDHLDADALQLRLQLVHTFLNYLFTY
ncbi:hypothetical protein GJ744_010036 [Endocarpon pusillum]|uniref:Uncharacterized protein n=1 Tax=Endocarpon pusillum TaxID=364733 RepID=A0A8H7AHB7_9EURO|nr:hypothetical protein GJ744_010036 [Endocarpon pusillum]